MIGKVLWLVVAAAFIRPAAAETCLIFDTPATVQGKVAAVEDYWILQVPKPLCVDSPPGDDLGTPAHNVQDIQLVFKDTLAAKPFTDQNVTVSGHLSPPHGNFNKRPVILEVETVKKQ
ncbi:MAG: hypothetical protein K2P94_16225 [Rhodospirillaceae bacterium]|nr:hypothetical protein [Rhodospirillaceae bacterium]